MRKWLYVLSIAVIIGALIFYYISTQSLVNGLKADSLALIESLNKIQEKYDAIDVKLNNPTYEQVKSGLVELKSAKVEGNCCNYAKCVQDYFYDKGLQCYIVISNRKNGDGHVSVAFDTDKGWIYAEPQVMAEYPIKEGESYYPPGVMMLGTAEDVKVTQLVIMR
jgi:hypothetical protein